MKKVIYSVLFLAFIFFQCGKESGLPASNPGYTPASYNHNLYPGNSAKDFLRSTVYKSLRVEIQHMPGFKPEPFCISLLTGFLEARLNKPEGIIIQLKEIDPTLKTIFSASEIADFEKNNRTVYTSGSQLGAYILLIDGSYSNGSVLALSYKNTSLCLFGEPFKYFSFGASEEAKAISMALLMEHELGHLFGLVDCGTFMVADHLDPEHTNHCINSTCLIHHSFESQARIFARNYQEIPSLDLPCLNDLKANGGK
jgi:hypothetical protein